MNVSVVRLGTVVWIELYGSGLRGLLLYDSPDL